MGSCPLRWPIRQLRKSVRADGALAERKSHLRLLVALVLGMRLVFFGVCYFYRIGSRLPIHSGHAEAFEAYGVNWSPVTSVISKMEVEDRVGSVSQGLLL